MPHAVAQSLIDFIWKLKHPNEFEKDRPSQNSTVFLEVRAFCF